MENSILVRYGELFLKGKNKKYFENTLLQNIKDSLSEISCNVYKISGRIIVNKFNPDSETAIISKLTKVFGIHSISPAVCFKTSVEGIKAYVKSIPVTQKTFRVTVNRADKTFPIKSIDFEKELGGDVLSVNPNLKVNLHQPELHISIDIRENGETFAYFQTIKGSGGMPSSTSGKAMLLLSGGMLVKK